MRACIEHRKLKRTAIIVVFLIFPFWMMGQSNNGNPKPKVGLVLSGGGAKGLAHIGALKVIEESGIKVDYIGGTSMGAIVGALYASGYSALELDSRFFNYLERTNMGQTLGSATT